MSKSETNQDPGVMQPETDVGPVANAHWEAPRLVRIDLHRTASSFSGSLFDGSASS